MIEIYFEDLPQGKILDFPTKTVTKDEIIAFASEFDPQPHHLDEEAAAKSMLGGLSAARWSTASPAAPPRWARPASRKCAG